MHGGGRFNPFSEFELFGFREGRRIWFAQVTPDDNDFMIAVLGTLHPSSSEPNFYFGVWSNAEHYDGLFQAHRLLALLFFFALKSPQDR